MHIGRLVCLILGLWLGGSLFMTLVATQNFRSVDRLLARPTPAAAAQVKALGGHAAARAFLRYQVAEQNRWYFDTWETAQIVLAAGLFFLLLFGTREGKFSLGVSLLLLVVVALQHLLLTPEITALGRVMDFQPPELASGEHRRFWMLHSAYSGTELFKWAVMTALAGRFLLWRRKPSGDVRQKLDFVNKADHGHVDR